MCARVCVEPHSMFLCVVLLCVYDMYVCMCMCAYMCMICVHVFVYDA